MLLQWAAACALLFGFMLAIVVVTERVANRPRTSGSRTGFRKQAIVMGGITAGLFLIGAWVITGVDADVDRSPAAIADESHAQEWAAFKRGAQDRLSTIRALMDDLTSGAGADAGSEDRARQVHQALEREVDRLRVIDRAGGVPGCYADAAAAYSRGIFALDTSASFVTRYYAREGDDLLELANDFLRDANAELDEWESLIPLADEACAS
jgi:hypothetical protein